jgi:hypothetical protein
MRDTLKPIKNLAFANQLVAAALDFVSKGSFSKDKLPLTKIQQRHLTEIEDNLQRLKEKQVAIHAAIYGKTQAMQQFGFTKAKVDKLCQAAGPVLAPPVRQPEVDTLARDFSILTAVLNGIQMTQAVKDKNISAGHARSRLDMLIFDIVRFTNRERLAVKAVSAPQLSLHYSLKELRANKEAWLVYAERYRVYRAKASDSISSFTL